MRRCRHLDEKETSDDNQNTRIYGGTVHLENFLINGESSRSKNDRRVFKLKAREVDGTAVTFTVYNLLQTFCRQYVRIARLQAVRSQTDSPRREVVIRTVGYTATEATDAFAMRHSLWLETFAPMDRFREYTVRDNFSHYAIQLNKQMTRL